MSFIDNQLHIRSRISKLKDEVISTYNHELNINRFNKGAVTIIIKYFESIVSRQAFFNIYHNNNEDVPSRIRKRKILNVFFYLEHSDWSNVDCLDLVRSVLLKVFTSQRSLDIFKKNIKEISRLTKILENSKSSET